MPKYAGPLLSSRRSRLSKRIPDISNVDRWLNIVTRKRGVSSMREGYVVCVVERLRIEVRGTHSEYSFHPLHDDIHRHLITARYLLIHRRSSYISQLIDYPFQKRTLSWDRVLGRSWTTLLAVQTNSMRLSGCNGRSLLLFSSSERALFQSFS